MVVTVDELRSLPPDVKEAFVRFESIVWARCFEGGAYDNNTWDGEAAYIDNIHAFASRMGLHDMATLTSDDIMEAGDQKFYWSSVKRYIDRFKIASLYDVGLEGRRPDPKILYLTHDLKAQLRGFIEQIRERILAANLPEKKRDVLIRKLSSLQIEVDRDRTSLQLFTDFTLDLADNADQVFSKLSPARRLWDRLLKRLSEIQSEQGRIGKSDEPAALESKDDGVSCESEDDSEIPF